MTKRGQLFNASHRKIYGEKSVDFSLLAIDGLVFAQVFTDKNISPWLTIIGMILFIVGIIVSYFFLKEKKGGEKHDAA